MNADLKPQLEVGLLVVLLLAVIFCPLVALRWADRRKTLRPFSVHFGVALGTNEVLTLDRRGFSAYRPAKGRGFVVYP